MKKSIFLVLLAVLLLAVNWIADIALRNMRIDLTEDRLYSLSEGTKSVLGNLDAPVDLRFYFSDKASNGLPVIKDYGKRVRDLLKEYEARSNGQISLTVIEPETFSEEEDEAVAYGLRGAQTISGEALYFGLVARDEADGQEIIPFFTQERESLVEYDLTQLIDRLSKGNSFPKLGVITNLPLQFGRGGLTAIQQGIQPQPYAIYEHLRQVFDIHMLGTDFEMIEGDIDVLMIAQAHGLGDQQRYLIDQYIMTGGNALVFVDPYSEAAALDQQVTQFGAPQASLSFNMPKLLKSWGVVLEEGRIVADLGLAQRVNMGAAADPRRQIVDFVPWLAVTADYLDRDDIITGQLDQLNLASAGVLHLLDDRRTTITPLLTSSRDAAMLDVFEVEGQPDPDRLIQMVNPTDETYVLGARIRGPATSAFSGRQDAGHIESADDINVLVLSDSDILEDRFWAQVQDFFGQRVIVPIADNGRFVINALDHLSGSDALISLRSRGVASRPFTVMERLRRDAEAEYLSEEQRLEDQLRLTEQKISELEAQNSEGGTFLTQEQLDEIEKFRTQALDTRQALRNVQRNLRKDIDRLQSWVIWLNILAIPALLVFFSFLRYRRMGRGGL